MVHRRPSFGVQLPEVERKVPWSEYVEMARAAEEAGFDSTWLGDHLLYRGEGRDPRGPWEVWTLLAALAAVTRRVRLGPLVACTAFHPPGLLAKMAATVDEVSGGRLVLGLGAGWNEEEFRAFGVPYDHRVSRFEEAFEIIRRLLTGERMTFRGRFHQADDALLLPAPRRVPPLMIGSNGPRMLGITLPHVQSWNTWYEDYGNDPRRFAELNERVSAAATAAGRDPAEIERSACTLVALSRDAPERPFEPDMPPLEGSREEIAAGLRELAEAGADEIILVITPNTEESIRELGEVIALI